MNSFEKFISEVEPPPTNLTESKAMRRAYIAGLRHAAEIARARSRVDGAFVTPYVAERAMEAKDLMLTIENEANELKTG